MSPLPPPRPREGVSQVTERFRVTMIDRGEYRRLNVTAENENNARRAALGAATDMRQCEIREIRPFRIGFAQALEEEAA